MKKEDKSLRNAVVVLALLLALSAGKVLTGYVLAQETGTVEVQGNTLLGEYITDTILPRFWDIISSPFGTPEMLWIVIPLLIVLLFMQIYFGRWRNERLGWSSAFGNWITLLFVGVNLFREMVYKYALVTTESPAIIYVLPAVPLGERFIPLGVIYKFLLIFALLFISALFMFILFMHAIPKSLSFIVSSPLAVYTFAFLMISVVYSDIPLDNATLVSAVLVYIFVIILFRFIKSLVPPSHEAERYLQGIALEKKRIKSAEKAQRTRKIHNFEKRISSIKRKIKSYFS